MNLLVSAACKNLILVVEDKEDDAHLLESTMRHVGIKNPLLVVTTGTQAIDYLAGHPPYHDRGNHPLPSSVFLDLKLPDMNGLEVLRWINKQESLRSTVIIVHSGFVTVKDVDSLYAAGANSFLRKSGDPSELREIVGYFRRCFDIEQ